MAMILNTIQFENIRLAGVIHGSVRLGAALRFLVILEVSDVLNIIEDIPDHRRYIIKKTA